MCTTIFSFESRKIDIYKFGQNQNKLAQFRPAQFRRLYGVNLGFLFNTSVFLDPSKVHHLLKRTTLKKRVYFTSLEQMTRYDFILINNALFLIFKMYWKETGKPPLLTKKKELFEGAEDTLRTLGELKIRIQ